MKKLLAFLISIFSFFTFLFSPIYSYPQSSTHYIIIIRNDGSAIWKLYLYTKLENPDEVNSFQSYIQELQKSHEELLKNFANDIQKIVLEASLLSKRKMYLSNFNLSAYIASVNDAKVGVIEYSFIWYNFSEIVGNTITIGDIFVGGFYLSDEDSLTIVFPRYLKIFSCSPSPSSTNLTSVTWNGPLVFRNRAPSLTLNVKQTSFTISTDKSSVSLNDQIKISGILDPSFSGLSIILNYTSPDGKVTTKLLRVSNDGSFEDTFSPSKEGEWYTVAKLSVTPQYSILSNFATFLVSRPFYEQPIFLAAVVIILLIMILIISKKFTLIQL